MSGPNDFTVSLASVIAALEDRVRNGVEQPERFATIFRGEVTSYELSSKAVAVTHVTGMRDRTFTVFQDGTDYTFRANRLYWVGAAADEGSQLDIEFTFREAPSGLTDFNPGSVVGTLLRAVSREITLLYAQMDEAYRRAFVDGATGVALDNVVALLGVRRNPAIKSTGTITFLRKRSATQSVVIPVGTRVTDLNGRIFVSIEEGRIPTEVEEFGSPAGASIRTLNRIAALIGVFRRQDDPAKAIGISCAPDFGPDERTITFTQAVPGAEVRIRYRPKSVTVAIEAQEPGPDGDVNAGTLILMPTPPRDVDAVINEEPTHGGQNPEADNHLRERAKHALERAGNATINAIRYAVLEVKGVESAEVLDHQADDAIPPGEVRVRYVGGRFDEVRSAVERTRAAGVVARVEEVVQLTVSGTFYIIPAGPVSLAAVDTFLDAVAESISALAIGAPLAVKRLNALAFAVPGLADVAEAQLEVRPPASSDPPGPATVVSDLLLASPSQLIRPSRRELKGVVLSQLRMVAYRTRTVGVEYDVDLQIEDSRGTVLRFRSLMIDIRVTARVALRDNPTQVPVRVGEFVRPVQFSASATGTLTIQIELDLPVFRAADHAANVEFVFTAAAYAGLAAANGSFDVTV